VNEHATLTTAVSNGETCAARFAYVLLNDNDVPAVEKTLKEVLEKKSE
jgi:hypothetical protein